MKAVPLTIHWHQDNQAIYSCHFEPNGKRLATAGGDNNVRIWKLTGDGEDRKVSYLSTLSKHTQAVNVVRFCPRGEMLASAGDDGNVILWIPSDIHTNKPFGEEEMDDKETWRLKHMCRSMGSEIYDLAWSPDGEFFLTGSMDNIARIYNSQSGQIIRQIAEHQHYVQGVAWDPLNEYVATQSSDRSVHIYTLKTKDGQFTLSQHGKISKMDLPPSRRTTSSSPAPPDLSLNQLHRHGASSDISGALASPVPSTPGTPTSFSMPMNPPLKAHSRRSSFSSSPSLRRSPSPSPALPLPAVKPADSPKIYSMGARNHMLYCNDAMTSFFRRLTFTPDGSLLLTPSGQFKVSHPSTEDGVKSADDIINTVYIYTRAGLNKPPIAHLPGHKKPSIAVSCSPIKYNMRKSPVATKHITVDTSSGDEIMTALPPPAMNTDKEAPTSAPSGSTTPSGLKEATNVAFSLPYRIVYAVATQDSVLIYDTQQQTPLCIVSNLHYAAFTDLTWAPDGLTLLMTSTDGFCSVVTFAANELGSVYDGPPAMTPMTPSLSATTMQAPFPTDSSLSSFGNSPFPGTLSLTATTPTTRGGGGAAPAASPARSLSSSSIATITSNMQYPPATTPSSEVRNDPTMMISSVPGVSSNVQGSFEVPLTTPPASTPPSTPATAVSSVLGKREATGPETAVSVEPESTTAATTKVEEKKDDADKGGDKKRRRIAPTPVSKEEVDKMQS